MERNNKEIQSNKDVFGVSGPFHLTSVDWGIQDHKRSIAASLVHGVYMMERDDNHFKRTNTHSAFAPIWWEFFHFQRYALLKDPVDDSIFGVIYKFKGSPSDSSNRARSQHVPIPPPSYVIAFRGTDLKPDTRRRDIYLDVLLPLKGLPYDSRYHKAIQAVGLLTSKVDPKNVWLTGHSLGAAIALQVGKDMAKKGIYIETFLFNPPYSSAPIEMIENPYLKTRIRVAKSFITAGLSAAFKGNKDEFNSTPRNDPFKLLCSWVPHLFVHPNDPISCEYIGYFEHRDKMEAMGMKKIENIAAKNSIMNMISAGVLGRDGEPSHLVPSALLIKNMEIGEQNLRVAHGIHQWWKPHSWMSKMYIFSECNCQ